jgi:hypothetical protein
MNDPNRPQFRESEMSVVHLNSQQLIVVKINTIFHCPLPNMLQFVGSCLKSHANLDKDKVMKHLKKKGASHAILQCSHIRDVANKSRANRKNVSFCISFIPLTAILEVIDLKLVTPVMSDRDLLPSILSMVHDPPLFFRLNRSLA